MNLLVGLALPVVPVTVLLVFSRYAARSYLDRVPVLPWAAIVGQIIGLFVCGAMHLALLGTAATAMSGEVPSDAARDWSAWVAIIGTVVILAAFAAQTVRERRKEALEAEVQLSETVRGRISNIWPSLLAIECAYITGASVVLRHSQDSSWSHVPAMSTLILVALVITYCIFLGLLKYAMDYGSSLLDEHMKGTVTHQGCAIAQPYFTVRAWSNDYFAAWPIIASGYMAVMIILVADTDNMRDPSEWRRMVPYVPFSAVGAVVTASAWQYMQPLYYDP